MRILTPLRLGASGAALLLSLLPTAAHAQVPGPPQQTNNTPPGQPSGVPSESEKTAGGKGSAGDAAADAKSPDARQPDPNANTTPVVVRKPDGTLAPLVVPTPPADQVGPRVKPYEPVDVIRYSDFMDTRLTWVFGDDDILKATGDRSPLSPNPSVGDRQRYRLFFDNLNSRFAGRENLTHLVLYRKLPGFIPNLDTEAAAVLRFDMGQLAARSNNVNSAFYDAGSYLRLFYKLGSYEITNATTGKKEVRPKGIDLVFFPLDTDRVRLGYLYDISWGGTAQSINQSIFPRLSGQAPGAKFQYTGEGHYVYVAFKTAQIVEPTQKVTGSQDIEFTRNQETNYGVLGGAGADVTSFLRVDAGAGYFQQGRFEQSEVLGQRVYTYGVSGRVVLHDKMPVPSSVDFALYRNDPNSPMVIFRPETYSPGTVAWSASVEASHLRQNLKVFNAAATTLQGATAVAAQGTVKASYFRLQGTAIYRDVPFVLRNQPSFIPFETLPAGAKTQAEMFFALAADYYVESAHLTPGLGLGLQMPSTFGSSSTNIFGTEISRTVVIRQQGDLAPLPEGKSRVPIIQARASLRWDFSTMMAAIFWLQYVRDNNSTRIEQASDGTNYLRQFVAPDFLGFGTAVQARF